MKEIMKFKKIGERKQINLGTLRIFARKMGIKETGTKGKAILINELDTKIKKQFNESNFITKLENKQRSKKSQKKKLSEKRKSKNDESNKKKENKLEKRKSETEKKTARKIFETR